MKFLSIVAAACVVVFASTGEAESMLREESTMEICIQACKNLSLECRSNIELQNKFLKSFVAEGIAYNMCSPRVENCHRRCKWPEMKRFDVNKMRTCVQACQRQASRCRSDVVTPFRHPPIQEQYRLRDKCVADLEACLQPCIM